MDKSIKELEAKRLYLLKKYESIEHRFENSDPVGRAYDKMIDRMDRITKELDNINLLLA